MWIGTFRFITVGDIFMDKGFLIIEKKNGLPFADPHSAYQEEFQKNLLHPHHFSFPVFVCSFLCLHF